MDTQRNVETNIRLNGLDGVATFLALDWGDVRDPERAGRVFKTVDLVLAADCFYSSQGGARRPASRTCLAVQRAHGSMQPSKRSSPPSRSSFGATRRAASSPPISFEGAAALRRRSRCITPPGGWITDASVAHRSSPGSASAAPSRRCCLAGE